MRKYLRLVGDFETTVYQNQTYTEVWASAVVKIGTEDVKIFHSIGETFDYLCSLNRDIIIYYHNLKFDGNFWLSFLLSDLKYQQALETTSPIAFTSVDDMPNNSFKYSISNMGQWYVIQIKHAGRIIEIRDSLKLLPLSVREIGKAFNTKHQKLDMEYRGFRYAGCEITEDEQKYIANDVLVVAEALTQMFDEGHKELTIGACCLKEFKTRYYGHYDDYFPNLYDVEIDKTQYGSSTAGEYIRRSYGGGWCYLVPEKAGQIFRGGVTADVNSLYPSVMHSESGYYYPIGKPHFWSGNFIPDEAQRTDNYYFVRLKTRFKLKDGMLPTIQLKHNLLYRQNEWLKTSDVYDYLTSQYCPQYTWGGKICQAIPEITLTQVDYEMLKKHYDLSDTTILDGCWFDSEIGLFDDYIYHYRKQKEESTGGRRTIAKLFLNNLYGKMGATKCSSFKYAYLRDDGSIGFDEVTEFNKTPGYVAIGSAITSYARRFTITAAQANYDSFIYSDTDSIHCNISADKLNDVPIHNTAFLHWKIEKTWHTGYFVRQKTYIECDEGGIEIKCAGMPERCKELLIASMGGRETEPKNVEEEEFIAVKRNLSDFKRGLIVPGKLIPKRIPGGVILKETTYELR